MTADELRRDLSYDAATGMLRWLRQSTRVSIGDRAGYSTKRGYRNIRIRGREFKEHRVIWFIVHAEWPNGDIDHIDGDKANNRLSNLRCVTHAVNCQNKRVARADSSTGAIGVGRNRSGFTASITIQGRRKYLGTFKTIPEASAVYLAEKRNIHEGNML